MLTEKQRFIKALKREKITGLVPTFELVFFLTMDAFGKVHPCHRLYQQWNQMSKKEQSLHNKDQAQIYVDTAKRYNHSAIFVQQNPDDLERTLSILEEIRNISGDEYFLMLHGDCTHAIPNGNDMMDFSIRIYEDPDSIKREAENNLIQRIKTAESYSKYNGLLDGFALCSDYAFNVNPFYSVEIFADLVTPYLERLIKNYRDMGYYSIKHSDGNIMPILDQIVECKPDAIHSIDPQGGMGLSDVKKLYGDKVTFCGNVNCGLLQTGTDEEVISDVRRSLKEGMEGGTGYIFCTSNCVYTGLELERYELMMDIWKQEGRY